MRRFSLAYLALVVVLHSISIPFLFFLSFKAKYRHSIPARFFLWKNPRFPKEGIWFHACSLGEVKSLGPILERLKGPVNITTITHTGFMQAKSFQKAEARYLPFESLLPFWVTPQRCLVVLEAELWYLLFVLAKQRGAKTILLNARITERSFHRYLRFAWLYRQIFAQIDLVFCQSEADRERLGRLGAKNIQVTGNLKLLQTPTPTKTLEKPSLPLLTAASTHKGEEELILHSFLSLKGYRLAIAPRHPERFEEVFAQCASFAAMHGYSLNRFSQNQSFESDITVVDTLGDLINIYAITHTVILGGAFAPIGGHNPIEPAHFGCRIISGENIFNMFALFGQIEHYQLIRPEHLTEAVHTAKEMPPSRILGSFDLQMILGELEDVA